MKRIKSVIAIITLVIFVLGLSGCGLITKTEEGKNKTAIAKVNGEKITLGEFNKRLALQKMQYEAYDPNFFTTNPTYLDNLKDQLYTNMLQEAVIMQKAEKLDLLVTDADLDKEVKTRLASDIKTAGGDKKFTEALAKKNVTKEQYTQDLKDSLKVSMSIEKTYDSITKPAQVTEKDIQAEYDLNPYKYTEKPNTMKVSHILVPTEAEAKKILKEINAGTTFEAAAKKYGTDGTKDKGGLLGDIEYTTTEYDADFVKGAIKTKTGTVSEPVKTQFGYHLIKVSSRKEYKVKPLASVKSVIKPTLFKKKQQDLFNTAFTTWYGAAKIEEFKDEINTETK